MVMDVKTGSIGISIMDVVKYGSTVVVITNGTEQN